MVHMYGIAFVFRYQRRVNGSKNKTKNFQPSPRLPDSSSLQTSVIIPLENAKNTKIKIKYFRL